MMDAVGLVGVSLIVGAYLGLQMGWMDNRKPAYSAVNAAGAGLVLWSLFYEFNLAAFLVEAFWVVISLVGLLRALRMRNNRGGAELEQS
jgi:hypothetical protein